MTFKEQEWKKFGRNGIKFELIVRDQDFSKIESIQFNTHDFKIQMKDISRRYGIDKKEDFTKEDVQDEIDWLKKESIL